MLIVYGWYTVEMSSKRPKEIVCHHCNKVGSVNVSKHAVLLQFLYIPLFPVKITDTFLCVYCHSELEYREMDNDLKAVYAHFKSKQFPRFWHFTGPLIILLIFAFSTFKRHQEKAVLLERINAATAGTKIEFETEDENYSSMMICGVAEESVEIVYNNYTVEDFKYIDNVLYPSFYATDTVEVERAYLEELVKNGQIKSVHQ